MTGITCDLRRAPPAPRAASARRTKSAKPRKARLARRSRRCPKLRKRSLRCLTASRRRSPATRAPRRRRTARTAKIRKIYRRRLSRSQVWRSPLIFQASSATARTPFPTQPTRTTWMYPSPRRSPPRIGKETVEDGNEGIIRPFHSFVLSFAMILFSEVGDKTFLVAALMAMKHDRMVVFTAAFGALLVMTFLSAILGHTLPALIPKKITAFLAAGLFFVFGAKLLREGMAMSPDEGVAAEMQEVEMEMAEKEHQAMKQGRRRSSVYAMEMGLGRNRKSRSKSRFPTPPRSPSTSPARSPSPRGGIVGSVGTGMSNLASLLLSPAWVQTFVMTFLGEWGDRSQIATIAMAAGQDYWWVTLGALVGHSICTGVAVIGGRAIAGKVSMKVVTVGGALAFLVFGFIYLFEALYA
ncbi:hypothetical protein PG989_016061 [Apiospora arundinis]